MEMRTTLMSRPVYWIIAVLAASPAPVLAADILIGTGFSADVQYSVGRSICRQLTSAGGASCEVLRVPGRDAAEPLAVLSNVRNGAIEVGIVPSDWHYHAFHGTGPAKFIDIRFDNLRSLFSLHGQPFTIIARRDADISSVQDLAGKRVNIGNPGSPHRAVMERFMQAKGWTEDTFQLADELNAAEQSLALCHNRVQAIVSTVSHPDSDLARMMKLCDARIIAVADADIERMLAEHEFFARINIPAGSYPGLNAAVATFGVKATAVTSADIDDDAIYSIVKSVFDRLEAIKQQHKALGSLAPNDMISGGLTAPMHAGALRYFREHGMM